MAPDSATATGAETAPSYVVVATPSHSAPPVAVADAAAASDPPLVVSAFQQSPTHASDDAAPQAIVTDLYNSLPGIPGISDLIQRDLADEEDSPGREHGTAGASRALQPCVCLIVSFYRRIGFSGADRREHRRFPPSG
jgi:hypothetical protein